MKKTIPLLLVSVAFGCSSVKSDLSFQKGKDCFWNGRYEEALVHLNKAVNLDPSSSRSHQQLAITYERLGNLTQAWEHARKAFSLNSQSPAAFDIFSNIFKTVFKHHHLNGPRKPNAKLLIETLGVADKYLHNDKGDLKALYYGPICLHIEDGKLSSTEWLNPIR